MKQVTLRDGQDGARDSSKSVSMVGDSFSKVTFELRPD